MKPLQSLPSESLILEVQDLRIPPFEQWLLSQVVHPVPTTMNLDTICKVLVNGFPGISD